MPKHELQRMKNAVTVLTPTDVVGVEHETKPIIVQELNRRRGLLERLFPTPTDKEVLRNHLALVKTHNEFTEKSLRAFCEAQLKALDCAYRDFVLRGAARITTEQTTFIMQEKATLSEEIQRIAEPFLARVELQLQKLDEKKSAYIRQGEERRLMDEIDDFQDTVTLLRRKFRQLLEAELGASAGSTS